MFASACRIVVGRMALLRFLYAVSLGVLCPVTSFCVLDFFGTVNVTLFSTEFW